MIKMTTLSSEKPLDLRWIVQQQVLHEVETLVVVALGGDHLLEHSEHSVQLSIGADLGRSLPYEGAQQPD